MNACVIGGYRLHSWGDFQRYNQSAEQGTRRLVSQSVLTLDYGGGECCSDRMHMQNYSTVDGLHAWAHSTASRLHGEGTRSLEAEYQE